MDAPGTQVLYSNFNAQNLQVGQTTPSLLAPWVRIQPLLEFVWACPILHPAEASRPAMDGVRRES